MRFFTRFSLVVAAGTLVVAGCNEKPGPTLAPESSALAPAAKASEAARSFEVATAGSKVTFLMSAPIENISGEAADSVQGTIYVDPTDVAKTTALIRIDLDKLVLHRSERKTERDPFTAREKNPKQNQHMKAWLEISDDAPPEEREKNRWVEYRIDKVIQASASDITKLTGAERKITATVEGELRVHQRKTRKQAKVEATFVLDGAELRSVRIKTTEPINVGLEEHDVRPRELFGKLAQRTLSDLGQKVAREAPVELELTATAK